MFDNNVGYPLISLTVNQMLQPFRLRAGQSDAPAEPFPMDFRVTSYTGLTQIWSLDRYGVEYGPILMAFVGPPDFGAGPSMRCIAIRHRPQDIKGWLLSKPDQPLHCAVSGFPQYECMPYGEVVKQKFTCFPIILLDKGT